MFLRKTIPTATTVNDLQKIVGAALAVEKDPLKVRTPEGILNVYRPATPEGWHGPKHETAISASELRQLPSWWPAVTALKVAKVKSLLRNPIWVSEAGPGNMLHSGSYIVMATRRDRVLLWLMDSPEWRPLQIYDRLNAHYGGFVSEILAERVIRTIPRRLGNGRISAWEKKPLSRLECQMEWRPVQPPKLAPMSPFSPEQRKFLRSKGWVAKSEIH